MVYYVTHVIKNNYRYFYTLCWGRQGRQTLFNL